MKGTTLGGLLRKQDQPSGFGGADPNAFSPAQRLSSSSGRGGGNRFTSRSDPSLQPSDTSGRNPYDTALGRAPSASPSTGQQNGGASGDYMAAMGGDWWRAWNQMSAAQGNSGSSAEVVVVDLPPGSNSTSPRSSLASLPSQRAIGRHLLQSCVVLVAQCSELHSPALQWCSACCETSLDHWLVMPRRLPDWTAASICSSALGLCGEQR